MRETLAWVGGIMLAIGLIIGVAFGAPWIKLQVMRMYGTEMESVRTDIYRENKSYVEGTVRDLRELRVEYEKADDAHKSALKSLIVQRAGELDHDRLPADLREFLNGLEN